MKKYTLALFLLLFASAAANATVISYDLDMEFSGATAPAGSGPWLTATFDDSDTAGSVMLTLESNISDPQGFISAFYFNFDPTLNAALIGIGAGTDTGWSSFLRGNDCCQADGSGEYDGVIRWDNGDFGGTDIFQFEFVMAGLTADMFDYLNTPVGGNGLFNVAAHVQGLGTDGEDSGWIGGTGTTTSVPAPASLLLMGLGLLGLGAGRLTRKS